jgi:hypothetical protein
MHHAASAHSIDVRRLISRHVHGIRISTTLPGLPNYQDVMYDEYWYAASFIFLFVFDLGFLGESTYCRASCRGEGSSFVGFGIKVDVR